ncbi:hypothetical protein KK062_28195 [Fulvivirgaceae bacterium PWU5]|uniref:DUF4386 domain-containing protein n=1 Tax=Dawidia cretensis TaxID=2782350 RepID=A0AAP2GWC9_9BACT|nr:hypothetical protein [Dawidia cretensis]MBT1712155.1 hypothetical protein [Dawidia cretensis]
MITAKMKVAAGVVCVLYILVQTFQWWVFAQAPSATPTPLEDFLFSAQPLSILRSWLMLFSMFGLFYIFFVLCLSIYKTHTASSLLALTGFFVFFLLEIILRSVELFYTQVHLPAEYAAATDVTRREAIVSFVTQFQQVQRALYFPLGLSQTVGSFIIAGVYPASPRYHYAIKAIMFINGLRLLLRMLTVYGGIPAFPANLYDTLYLPLVYVTFGVMAWWFFRSRSTNPENVV